VPRPSVAWAGASSVATVARGEPLRVRDRGWNASNNGLVLADGPAHRPRGGLGLRSASTLRHSTGYSWRTMARTPGRWRITSGTGTCNRRPGIQRWRRIDLGVSGRTKPAAPALRETKSVNTRGHALLNGRIMLASSAYCGTAAACNAR
jgi:hypothetical protein